MSARKPFAKLTGNEQQHARGRKPTTKARKSYPDWAANDKGNDFWSDPVDSITPVISNCESDRTATHNRAAMFRPRPAPPDIQVPASLKKKKKPKRAIPVATLLRRRKRFWKEGFEQVNRENRMRKGSAPTSREDSISSSSASSDEEAYEMDISSDSEDEASTKPDDDGGNGVPTTGQALADGFLPLFTPRSSCDSAEGNEKPNAESFDASGSLLEQSPSSKETVTTEVAVLGGHEVLGSARLDATVAGEMETKLDRGPFNELSSSPNQQQVPSANELTLYSTPNVPCILLEPPPCASTPLRSTEEPNDVVAPSGDETAVAQMDRSRDHDDRRDFVRVEPTKLSQVAERSEAHQQHRSRSQPSQGQPEVNQAHLLGFVELANLLDRSTSAEVVKEAAQTTPTSANQVQFPNEHTLQFPNEHTLEPNGESVLVYGGSQAGVRRIKARSDRVLETALDLETLKCEDASSPSKEVEAAKCEEQLLAGPGKERGAHYSTELASSESETANATGSNPSQESHVRAHGRTANKDGERKTNQPEANAKQQPIKCSSDARVNNEVEMKPPHASYPTPFMGSKDEPREKAPTPTRPEYCSSFPKSPRRCFHSTRLPQAISSVHQAVNAPSDTMSQEAICYDFVCTAKGPTFLPSLDTEVLMSTVPPGWTKNTCSVACYDHPHVGRMFLHPLARYEGGHIVATALQGTSHLIAARQTTNIDASQPTPTTRKSSPNKTLHLQDGLSSESALDSESNHPAQNRTETLAARQLCAFSPTTQNMTDSKKGSDSLPDYERDVEEQQDNADLPLGHDGLANARYDTPHTHVDYQSPDQMDYEGGRLIHRSVDSPCDDTEFPSSDNVEDEGDYPSDEPESSSSDLVDDEGDREDPQSEHNSSPPVQRYFFGAGGQSNVDSVDSSDDDALPARDPREADCSERNSGHFQASTASSTSSSVSRQSDFPAPAPDCFLNSSFASPLMSPFVTAGACDELISPLGEDGASTLGNDDDHGRLSEGGKNTSTPNQRQLSGMGGRPNSQLVSSHNLDDSYHTDWSNQNSRQLQSTPPSRKSSGESRKLNFSAHAFIGVSDASYTSPFVTIGDVDDQISPLGDDGASILGEAGNDCRDSRGTSGRGLRNRNPNCRLCSLQNYWIPEARALVRQRKAKDSAIGGGDPGAGADSIVTSGEGNASQLSRNSRSEGGSGISHRAQRRGMARCSLQSLVTPTPRINKKRTRSVESEGVREKAPKAKRSRARTATNARRRRKTS